MRQVVFAIGNLGKQVRVRILHTLPRQRAAHQPAHRKPPDQPFVPDAKDCCP